APAVVGGDGDRRRAGPRRHGGCVDLRWGGEPQLGRDAGGDGLRRRVSGHRARRLLGERVAPGRRRLEVGEHPLSARGEGHGGDRGAGAAGGGVEGHPGGRGGGEGDGQRGGAGGRVAERVLL